MVFYTDGYETTWMVLVSGIMVLHLHVFLFFQDEAFCRFVSQFPVPFLEKFSVWESRAERTAL